MPWWLKSPGHQQEWYWPNKPEYPVCNTRKVNHILKPRKNDWQFVDDIFKSSFLGENACIFCCCSNLIEIHFAGSNKVAHYWDYYPDALPLCQVIASHLKIGYPYLIKRILSSPSNATRVICPCLGNIWQTKFSNAFFDRSCMYLNFKSTEVYSSWSNRYQILIS